MLRGIYTAASGMLVQSIRSDVLANNLANVDTAGYHKQTPQVEAFPDKLLNRQDNKGYTPIGRLGTGSAVASGGRYSFMRGSIQPTGNDLDVALAGFGFFVIDTPGQASYTRDGRFTLDSGGWLTTLDGHRVRGENGPIFVGEGKVTIDNEGTIFVEGVERDKLLVVEFLDRTGLAKQGANLYQTTEGTDMPFRFRSEVIQGSIEMSNVNLVREMVNLIEVQRAYEANQRVVQAYDETVGKAVNEISG